MATKVTGILGKKVGMTQLFGMTTFYLPHYERDSRLGCLFDLVRVSLGVDAALFGGVGNAVDG